MKSEPKQSFTSRTEATRDDWQTPKHIVDALGLFDLDPCANCTDPKRLALHGFTAADDGLAQSWIGRVWLNPPYGADAKKWVRKLADHGNGIALIPPRMGSQWFQDLFSRASAALFLRGRVAFIDASTGLPVSGNNADSVLLAFGESNAAALYGCALRGILVDHKQGVIVR